MGARHGFSRGRRGAVRLTLGAEEVSLLDNLLEQLLELLEPEGVDAREQLDPLAIGFEVLPLIVVTVVIHVVGLGLINERIVQPLSGIVQRLRFTVGYIVIMAVVAWLVTILMQLRD